MVLLDNPAVPDAASSGLLATAEDVGIDTSGFDANLAGPGTVDGVSYGVPIGANTLGLYYNEEILDRRRRRPRERHRLGEPERRAWPRSPRPATPASRSPASPARRGCSSSCRGSGVPAPTWRTWARDEAVAAGQLVSDWIGKGYAPKSALTDNQSASWDLFLTGEYAFAENGSWFAKAASELTDFTAVAMPLPGQDGGAAPAPTGGEFVLAPLQKNDAEAHYANASKVIDCLVGKDNQVKTADALGLLRREQGPACRADRRPTRSGRRGRPRSRVPRVARRTSVRTTPLPRPTLSTALTGCAQRGR